MDCMKSEWKDSCCCNCRYQRTIKKHPWNDGAGKGSISEAMGFGCQPPEFDQRTVIFFDSGHGLCEMHEAI